MMAIKLYWHRGPGRSDPGRQNFGDYLSPLIVEAVSGKRVEYAPVAKADLIAIGTILAKEVKARFWGFKRKLHVWGSGCGHPDERFGGHHYYHAVRGLETLSRIIGEPEGVALGDPGLLASLLLKGPIVKKYKIGFVPHYVDQNHSACSDFVLGNRGVYFVDVFKSPLQVVEEISACDFVISTSLHGLVVADSFGIPNVRLKLSDNINSELKYADYYSIFGIKNHVCIFEQDLCDAGKLMAEIEKCYYRHEIANIKDNIIKAFPDVM